MSDESYRPLPHELSTVERAAYATAGLFLAAVAVRPRPNKLLSVLALATGCYLAYRGATGRYPVRDLIDRIGGDDNS